VAGSDEAKEELQEIIDFLKDPQKFQKLAGTFRKGVLLRWASRYGQDLAARAIAGEAKCAVLLHFPARIREMFVGVGRQPRTRPLLNRGKKNAPCIIFIDEMTPSDAIVAPASAGGTTNASKL